MPSNYIEGFNEEEKVELVLKVCPVTKKKKKTRIRKSIRRHSRQRKKYIQMHRSLVSRVQFDCKVQSY